MFNSSVRNLYTINNTSLDNLTITLQNSGINKQAGFYLIQSSKANLMSRLFSFKHKQGDMRLVFDAALGDSIELKASSSRLATLSLRSLIDEHPTHAEDTKARVIFILKSRHQHTHELDVKIDLPAQGAAFTRYKLSKKHAGHLNSGKTRVTNLSGQTIEVTASAYAESYSQKNNYTTTFIPTPHTELKTGDHHTADDMSPREAVSNSHMSVIDGEDIFYDALSDIQSTLTVPSDTTHHNMHSTIMSSSMHAYRWLTDNFQSVHAATNHFSFYFNHSVGPVLSNTYHTIAHSINNYVTGYTPEDIQEREIPSEAQPEQNNYRYLAKSMEVLGYFFTGAFSLIEQAYQSGCNQFNPTTQPRVTAQERPDSIANTF